MGHIELVEWLLDQGANPRLCDDENHTAFFVAAGGGFKDVAVLLYEEGGVDVDDVDIYGLTALDWAREKGTSVPEDSEEFEAIKATIEWLLYKRASPCACASFQLYPGAASGSSEAPVPANSAAPTGIRSSEPALALALASILNRRIYIRARYVDYGGEDDEDVESEDEEGLPTSSSLESSLESFEGRSFLSPSTGDSAVSLFDEIVALGEESDQNYDPEVNDWSRHFVVEHLFDWKER